MKKILVCKLLVFFFVAPMLLGGCASAPVPYSRANADPKIVVPPKSDDSTIKLGKIPPKRLSSLGQ